MKHLLKLEDWSTEEITRTLNLADQLKYEQKHGIAHKLRRVDFGIPVRDENAKALGDRYDLTAPWHVTDDKGRLDLAFTPDIDRCDYIDFKLVISDQHQVFGLFNGFVKLDDGTTFEIRDLRGSAEAVHNMY